MYDDCDLRIPQTKNEAFAQLDAMQASKETDYQ